MKKTGFLHSPIGTLLIEESNGGISRISLVSGLPVGYECEETPLLRQACRELTEYFVGERKRFEFSLSPSGTEFQQKVWAALETIPYGETRTYRQIAEQVGNPKACRAVGAANHRNPLLIVIPCHRIVGTGGRMVGYACGIPVKEALLALEQKCPGTE